jgi:RND superfamily putative drug exporter
MRAFAGALGRRPGLAMALSVAVLAAGALGNLVSLPPLGFGQGFLGEPDSIQGEQIIDREYPAGLVAPINIVTTPAAARRVAAAIVAERRRMILLPVDPVSSDRRRQALAAALFRDPFSQEATDGVPAFRRTLREAARGAPVLVGGLTAQAYDTEQAYADDAKLLVPLILGAVFLIFAGLLRSVVAPVYLVATVVLSFAFALGASKVIFAEVLDMPGLAPEVPILAFIFLVALGSDYNVFLLTRGAEERRRRDDRGAVLEALVGTAGVITGAGLVLAGTFAALITIPLTSMVQLGITVALGVLVDTFLVRTVLVPSIALVLGRWSWWPGASAARSVD